MKIKTVSVTILLVTVSGIGGFIMGSSIERASSGEKVAQTAERKVKYWIAPMDPTYIRNEPGKSPMGMDLVPVYEEEEEKPKERKVKYWIAPMDPTYIQNEPGKSPMGMDLVPVYEEEEEDVAEDGISIRVDPAIVQNIGVRTTAVEKRQLRKEIRTVGLIDYDERRYANVHSKVQGWVEELYVDFTGQFVKSGEPLLAIYSPELVSTQEEYLTVTHTQAKNDGSNLFIGGSAGIISSTRKRLEYWDITDEQIQKLEDTGEVTKLMKLYSPFDGIVVHKNALNGMEVKPGMVLYQIADLTDVWVYADIYEYEIPWLEEGLEAEMTLSYVPGKTFSGTVAYVYPFLDEKTRTLKVRLEFDNRDYSLKPGMYANIKIYPKTRKDAIVIPSQAIIRSGEREIVFIKTGKGRYSLRELTLGIEGEDGYYEVLEGLSEGDEIVISGQFLLDSESSLREAAQRRLEAMGLDGGETGEHKKMQMDGAMDSVSSDMIKTDSVNE